MRIVFLGSPEEVIPPLKTLYEEKNKWELVAVVSQPAKTKGRGKILTETPIAQWSKERSIPVLLPEKASDPVFLNELRALKPDLMVTAAYGQILTDEFLSIPTRGTINIHPSLLPKYRGATPIPAALFAGDQQTGVTILFTVRKMDAGPIILQESSNIEPHETAQDLTERLFYESSRLLEKAIELLADQEFKGTTQDEDRVTHCRKISKEAGLIDWRQPALNLSNQFRACFPWPGSFLSIAGQRVIVEAMEVAGGSGSNLKPGQFLFEKTLDCLLVGTGIGNIKISKLKPEGKPSMPASAFYNGIKSKGLTQFDLPTDGK